MSLRKNMQAATVQYAIGRVEEMIEDYKNTQKDSTPDSYTKGVIDGMQRVICIFENELKEVTK